MNTYILVEFPEIQYFMEREDFSECVFCNNDDVPSSSYFVPKNIHDSVFDGSKLRDTEYVLIGFVDANKLMQKIDFSEFILSNSLESCSCDYFLPLEIYLENI